MGSEGFIGFGSDSTSSSNQCPLPHTRNPSDLIALMWDDLDPTTIAPNSSATFDVLFDASSLYEVGDYRAQLGFSGNFVNDPGTIPLSMGVTCATCGVLNGAITAGSRANPLPANIHVTGANGFDVTITGDRYNLTLLPGEYDLTVESSGYFTQHASVKVTEGKTITTDFALLAKVILLPFVSK